MKDLIALVLGVNGQDGSFLAEELMAAGYLVTGAGRQRTSRHVRPGPRFEYRAVDLEDSAAVEQLLRRTMPDAIYHMAAVHGSSGFSYEENGLSVLRINTLLVQQLLEFLRRVRPDATLTCAGSAKQFGSVFPAVVDENSPLYSSCLYSISKNSALELIRYYRARHNVRAGMVYYWNHESGRRAETFFIPLIVEALDNAVRGVPGKITVNTLDFWCDWGAAEEYMRLTRLMAEKAPEQDVVMATGRTLAGYQLVATLFNMFGKEWSEYLRCDASETARRVVPEADAVPAWRVDPGKLLRITGARPVVTIEDVCLKMLAAKNARSDRIDFGLIHK